MALPLLRMEIRHEYDVVLVRQRARQIAAALKFDSQDQTRIATALSEVARNAFQYAGGGLVEFQIETPPAAALSITVSDRGRGIENLREILDGKYVSHTGMGLGMIGARRLTDVFQVESTSRGTKVVLGRNLPPRFSGLSQKGLDNLLAQLELQGPQNAYEDLQQQNQELLRALDELRTRQLELAQLNRELDETNRGVVALYAELDDRADFLQRASELKSHFLSNMSHEFRTPLNSIMALSQILLDHMDGELTEEQDKQVRFIKNSAQDLSDLVNDLLDLGKMQKVAKGTGLGLPLSRKLAQLLGGNVSVTSDVGVGSVFTVRIPMQFRGATEVAQVSDSKPQLDATKLPVLVVEDNRETLFIYEKYLKDSSFQVVPASSIREARAAMRAMRPHAILLDVLLQGEHAWDFLQSLKADPATRDIPVYVITVVDNREKALALGADAFNPKPVERAWLMKQLEASVSSHPSHQVLVVDDDATARYLLKVVLSQANYDIAEAGGGLEGLRMARELSPALIVLDLVMDDLSGFEVLEQLSADPATRSIPVVIHTSKELDKTERARLSAAIDIAPEAS